MNWNRIGAISALLAVALGAFGAHGLHDLLVQNQAIETWKTASLYHLTHSIAMLLPLGRSGRRVVPAALFAIGILFFSGSLYVLSLTGVGWLGAITPLGGLALMGGWLAMALGSGSDSPAKR